MEKIRLGIIGCGMMTGNHSQSFDSLKDVLTVTCTCDKYIERAEAAAKALGAEHAFADYKDMVDYVDAVLVVLPHAAHFDCGMFFIQNHKHVLMEKPMCVTEEECIKLTKASEEYNVKLMTAYCVRYMEPIVRLKEFVDNGVIGDVFQMSVWTEQFSRGKGKEGAGTVARLGGGQLFSHGCHYIDILLWFLGNPVRGFHMGTNFGTPWMEMEGTSNVVIEFENGALGYHMGTWGAVGTRHGWEFQIHGTKGMLAYSKIGEYGGKIALYKNLGAAKEHNEDPNATDIEVLWETNDIFGKKTAGEIRHFVKCINEDLVPETNAYESIQGLRVIWKLYEAEQKGVVADLRGLGLKQPCKM